MISPDSYVTKCGLIGIETSLKIGDRVTHVKDHSLLGTIRVVEENLLSVMVEWDDVPGEPYSFHWSNKIAHI